MRMYHKSFFENEQSTLFSKRLPLGIGSKLSSALVQHVHVDLTFAQVVGVLLNTARKGAGVRFAWVLRLVVTDIGVLLLLRSVVRAGCSFVARSITKAKCAADSVSNNVSGCAAHSDASSLSHETRLSSWASRVDLTDGSALRLRRHVARGLALRLGSRSRTRRCRSSSRTTCLFKLVVCTR